MTGFTCYHWQNLSITAVSALSSSRPLFVCNMVHPCDHPAVLGWLPRGFPLRTPIGGWSVYVYFLRNSWKKCWLLTKTMQIDIQQPTMDFAAEACVGCPVNMLFSASFLDHCYLGPSKIVDWVRPVVSHLQLPHGLKSHSVIHTSLLKPVHPDPFQQQPWPLPPVMEVRRNTTSGLFWIPGYCGVTCNIWLIGQSITIMGIAYKCISRNHPKLKASCN